MDKIKSPIGRFFIHVALILFAIYSAVPFVWTALQSFKTLKDANSRTPNLSLRLPGRITRSCGCAQSLKMALRLLFS
jgi:ABC-type glycerol-3-phosphate transport system permease component